MTVLDVVRDERIARGISQRQLARAAGLSSATVSLWERHLRAPTVDSVDALLGALNIHAIAVEGGWRSAADSAGIIRALLVDDDAETARVELGQLGRHLQSADPLDVAVLCAGRPVSTGDAHFDAAIAGIAEFRLGEIGLPAPRWAAAVRAEFTDPSLGRSWNAAARARTPEPLLRRGVILPLPHISGPGDGRR